jgi:hypothetical protein
VIELALSSCGEQDAFAEQVEFGAAVHLSLIILMRLTVPSTVPELWESVSPLRTAW